MSGRGLRRSLPARRRRTWIEHLSAPRRRTWRRRGSTRTRHWIAECNRLLDRCVAEAAGGGSGDTRASFELLFELLRHLDDGRDDIVFFADEAGSWQVGVEWGEVLPAWFSCLACSAEPDEYARQVVAKVDAFAGRDRGRLLRAARRAATPRQKKTLAGV